MNLDDDVTLLYKIKRWCMGTRMCYTGSLPQLMKSEEWLSLVNLEIEREERARGRSKF